MKRSRLLLVLAALAALGPLSVDMYLPGLPALSADLSSGTSSAQLTLTACLVGLAAGQAVAGPLSDAHGRRPPLLAGLALYTASTALCAAAPSVETLIAARLVQGAAGGAAIVIGRAVVRDLYEGAAVARVFSVLMQITGAAPIIAPLVGGQVLRLTSWRGVFVAIAMLGALLLLATLRWTEETLPRNLRRAGGLGETVRSFAALVADRAFVMPALAGGLAFAAMFVYIAGATFVLQELHGLSAQWFSVVFALNGLGIVVAGRLGSRLPARRQLTVGATVSLVGALALLPVAGFGWSLALLLPALALVVAGVGLSMPGSAALAVAGAPRAMAGSASALLGLSQFAIGGFAAPLAGGWGSRDALPMAVIIAVLSTAAAAMSLLSPGGPLASAGSSSPAGPAFPGEPVFQDQSVSSGESGESVDMPTDAAEGRPAVAGLSDPRPASPFLAAPVQPSEHHRVDS